MRQGQVRIETAQGSMPRNTKNESKCVPSATQWCRKGQKTWEPATHEKGLGTSRNPRRWTMKEGGWGSFSLIERNLPIWRKWQKVKQLKSWSKKWYLEVLGKERLEVTPLEPPRTGNLARGFWEGTSKKENSEKIRKGLATNVAEQHWF